jgi:glutamate-1-semialdehyde 2,1-aminomutase
MRSEASAQLYERARRSIPAGTHSNSRAAAPHPRYFARASGGRLWDVDGNEWIDLVMGNAAVILGHGDPWVRDAVSSALGAGLGAGVESELSVSVAERFLALVPTADQVRFTNTGTEAAMHVVHLARAVTGRAGIAKSEGAYHGWWDEVFVSTWPDLTLAGGRDKPAPLPGGQGLDATAVGRAVVFPFNDLAATRRILQASAERIAALFVEPAMIDVGFIAPEPGYLEGLRELTAELGIVLVFDELLTGFRLGNGGAQVRYGVTPDLSIWSKGLANGFPVAAVAGRRELMERTAPGPGNAPFVGTFNGFRPGLAACAATLDRLADGAVAGRLEARSSAFAAEWNSAARRSGVEACMHAGGGHFQPYFTAQRVRDYRSAATTDPKAYAAWRDELTSAGLLAAGGALLHSAISDAHTDEDLERVLQASARAFERIGRERADA